MKRGCKIHEGLNGMETEVSISKDNSLSFYTLSEDWKQKTIIKFDLEGAKKIQYTINNYIELMKKNDNV